MKTTHLKFSVIFFCGIMILLVITIPTKIKQIDQTIHRKSTEMYFNKHLNQENNKEYRYYLNIFKLFNAH